MAARLKIVTVMLAGTIHGTALAQERGDLEAGIDLAVDVCGQCHGVGFEEESSHPHAPTFFEIAGDPAATELALRVFLQTPHAEMPDLRLSRKETDDVIAYILSLRG
ncbi:MAG: hypothetical protein R3349_04975 [Geminicoccaceae bacterium]|nr:hypothetical protein [Geminicoccaceae bacterium]